MFRRRAMRPLIFSCLVLTFATFVFILLFRTIHTGRHGNYIMGANILDRDFRSKDATGTLLNPLHAGQSVMGGDDKWKIPTIIHYVWKSETFPWRHKDKVESFYKNHPQWKFYLWTDDSAKQMLADKYPGFLKKYNLFGVDLLRADAIRYAILYEYGGAYFDMDTWSIKPLDDAILNHSAVFCPEPIEHSALLYNTTQVLSNANMIARAKHPFLKHLMNAIPLTNETNKFKALYLTGPMFVTQQFHNYSKTYLHKMSETGRKGSEVTIVSSEYFQDNLDPTQYGEFVSFCENDLYGILNPLYKQGCESWTKRGMGDRELSTKAYTKHEWFHTYMVTLSNVTFNITDVIPGVKIYPEL